MISIRVSVFAVVAAILVFRGGQAWLFEPESNSHWSWEHEQVRPGWGSDNTYDNSWSSHFVNNNKAPTRPHQTGWGRPRPRPQQKPERPWVEVISNNGYGWTKKDVISFYRNAYCSGDEYSLAMSAGESQCQNLPKDVFDWNLSLKTFGSCIEVFDSEDCRHHSWRGLATRRVFRADQCRSTKLSGLDVVRSFKKCKC